MGIIIFGNHFQLYIGTQADPALGEAAPHTASNHLLLQDLHPIPKVQDTNHGAIGGLTDIQGISTHNGAEGLGGHFGGGSRIIGDSFGDGFQRNIAAHTDPALGTAAPKPVANHLLLQDLHPLPQLQGATNGAIGGNTDVQGIRLDNGSVGLGNFSGGSLVIRVLGAAGGTQAIVAVTVGQSRSFRQAAGFTGLGSCTGGIGIVMAQSGTRDSAADFTDPGLVAGSRLIIMPQGGAGLVAADLAGRGLGASGRVKVMAQGFAGLVAAGFAGLGRGAGGVGIIVAQGLPLYIAASLADAGLGTGSGLIAVAQSLAGSLATAVTGSRSGAGCRGILMAQGAAGGKTAIFAGLGFGAGGRLKAVAQSLAAGFATDLADLGFGAGGILVTVAHGVATGLAAGLAGLGSGAGSGGIIMARGSEIAGVAMATQGAGIGSSAAHGATGFLLKANNIRMRAGLRFGGSLGRFGRYYRGFRRLSRLRNILRGNIVGVLQSDPTDLSLSPKIVIGGDRLGDGQLVPFQSAAYNIKAQTGTSTQIHNTAGNGNGDGLHAGLGGNLRLRGVYGGFRCRHPRPSGRRG